MNKFRLGCKPGEARSARPSSPRMVVRGLRPGSQGNPAMLQFWRYLDGLGMSSTVGSHCYSDLVQGFEATISARTNVIS